MKAVSFLPIAAAAQIMMASAFVAAYADTPAAPPPPAAPAPAAPAPAAEKPHAHGKVTTIDLNAKTITVTGRGGANDVTFSVNDQTIFMVSYLEKVSDLKVGDEIHVFGDLNGTTIAAEGISYVGEHRPNRPNAAPGRPQFGVFGEITAVTPALTIKTADDQNITVTTTDATEVEAQKSGSISDVAVGDNVNAILSSTDAASSVHITPAALARFGRPHRAQ